LQSSSDPKNRGKNDPPGEQNAALSEAAAVALNQQISKAVVKGLSHFGAGAVVESLVYILELEHSVDLHSLANNLDALRAALQKMFGSATYVIEERIDESLAKQLGIDRGGKSLEELVEILKARIDEFIPTEKKVVRN